MDKQPSFLSEQYYYQQFYSSQDALTHEDVQQLVIKFTAVNFYLNIISILFIPDDSNTRKLSEVSRFENYRISVSCIPETLRSS